MTNKIDYNAFHIHVEKLKKTIKKSVNDEMGKFNLRSMHSLPLITLFKHPEGLTLAELTNELCIDKANTTRAVNSLIKRGLVIKDQTMSRGFKVKLSKSGQDIAKSFNQAREQNLKLLMSGLTEEDFEHLIMLINKMNDGIKQVEEKEQT